MAHCDVARMCRLMEQPGRSSDCNLFPKKKPMDLELDCIFQKGIFFIAIVVRESPTG